MKQQLILFSFLFLSHSGIAQGHQPVFPDLTGAELITNLQSTYRPDFVLNFSDARDTLFSRVYTQDDTLTCVYSGHKLYMDPTADPTVWAFQDNALWGINTEHTWPRAKGADAGNPRADMHHLHPTRIAVNAGRANLPFAEIADGNVNAWYYLTMTQSSIPTQNIDWYSEQNNSEFEPREDHKGNVARAMFYFYTIYRTEADLADPNYFAPQRATLCQWHHEDPVDALEWDRTWIIAQYQDGQPNPFVLDCTLPERTYCQDIDLNCTPVSATQSATPTTLESMEVSPNPFKGTTTITIRLRETAQVTVHLYDEHGRKQAEISPGKLWAGSHQISFAEKTWAALPSGLYYCQVVVDNRDGRYQQSRRVLKIK